MKGEGFRKNVTRWQFEMKGERNRGRNGLMRKFPKPVQWVIKFFTSLKLTVVLLSFALALTFFGTLKQVDEGLYEVQRDYFQSMWIVWHQQPIPKAEGGTWFTIVIPLLGGYLLGKLLLINLIAGFVSRFKWTRKKIGIYISHMGLICLLMGQWFTEMMQVESNIRFEEGQHRNYSEAFREFELAIIGPGESGNREKQTTVPESLLRKTGVGNVLSRKELPWDIKVLSQYANATVSTNTPVRPDYAGAGRNYLPEKKPEVFTMDDINVPAYEIALLDKTAGTVVDKYLVSAELLAQTIESAPEKRLQMRFTRYYKPFTLYLIDFRHDKFVGTDTPRNFSSLVQLVNGETGENRTVNIRMNSPLRYNGEAYFQASFDKVNPRVTVLQVVRNPSWLIPYISCAMMTAGLLIQFLFHLTQFVSKQMNRRTKSAHAAT